MVSCRLICVNTASVRLFDEPATGFAPRVFLAGAWVSGPVAKILLLFLLVIVFGLKPGFEGYRWHIYSSNIHVATQGFY